MTNEGCGCCGIWDGSKTTPEEKKPVEKDLVRPVSPQVDRKVVPVTDRYLSRVEYLQRLKQRRGG